MPLLILSALAAFCLTPTPDDTAKLVPAGPGVAPRG